MTIDTGDVRSRHAVAEFDIVTLQDNLYDFGAGEQTVLLADVRGSLRRGGVWPVPFISAEKAGTGLGPGARGRAARDG